MAHRALCVWRWGWGRRVDRMVMAGGGGAVSSSCPFALSCLLHHPPPAPLQSRASDPQATSSGAWEEGGDRRL